ncbi:MAG: cell division protein FtsB [gamma proteobacterium symbiont of Taylorina sp.]|nr:cell division protein FtsB [gamma proteobacterium symbiont of Taylorina sp.]
MNYVIALLLILLVVLQYDFWVGKGSIHEARQLEVAIQGQKKENQQLRERNDALQAEVIDLKDGLDAIEERARTELGMIQKNEVFFHVTETKK